MKIFIFQILEKLKKFFKIIVKQTLNLIKNTRDQTPC